MLITPLRSNDIAKGHFSSSWPLADIAFRAVARNREALCGHKAHATVLVAFIIAPSNYMVLYQINMQGRPFCIIEKCESLFL